MCQFRQRLFFLLFLVFAACPAYCSEYFVDPNGNDTTGNGTIGSPFKTITKGVSTAVAGDTIYLRGGTHTYTTTISISKSGTSGSKYYLFAYNGEKPILNFSSMSESSGNRGITLSGSYWHIKGIDIYKAGDNGLNISGSNNIIELCNFYENRDSGLQIGGGGAYNQIINCDSYYNADSDNGDADGFAPKLDVGTGNYFYGCRAWNNSDDAYDGYLRGADDVTTTYENCWAMKAGYLKSGSTGTGNGNGFKMGGSDDKLLKHNVILKNCMAFQNWKKGFDQNSDKGSMTLYNCTAFDNGTYNYSIPLALASGKTATLTNCTYFTGSNDLGAFVVQTTNDWSTTSSDFVSVDPSAAYGARQADGSLPDITFMHLATGSDLIDAGTDVGLPYNGSAPDIGCFETDGSSLPGAATNPTPTNGVTNISLTQDLSWTAGGGATSRDVYFGTVSTPVTKVIADGTALTYDTGTMATNTTYYWRVDEKNTNGTTTGTVWSFTTVPPLPGAASSPSPSNGATSVGITTDLSWTTGSGATSHDVYFGTVNPPPSIGNQTGTTYDTGTMAYSTTYYWRIDEKNAGGTTTGTVWSFTTVAVPLPGAASNPSPSNGATSVGITTDLSWTAGSYAVSHDVYFGTVNPPTFIGNQAGTTYDTGTMAYSTTYYWRIDEKNASGTTTGTVWSFTTAAAPPPGAATNPTPANGATDVGLTQDLSWTAGSGAASRDVYFGTVNPPVTKVISDGTALTYDTGTMAYSTTYYWRVDEKNTSGTTTGTVWNFTTVADTTPPAAPTGLESIADDNAVVLDWSSNSEGDLAGYNVYRSTTSGSGYGKLNGSLVSDSNYIDYTAANGTTYYYVVTAVDTASNESDNSSQISATPRIYGDFIINGIVEMNDLSYFCDLWLVDDCNATADVDLDDDCMVNFYEFSAFADNWRRTSIQPPDTTPPLVPTGLTPTAGNSTVGLDWNDNSEGDLAGYNIYRSTTSGSGYTQLNGSLLTSSNYTDNSVTNGTTYYYVVTATDTNSNESDYSGEASATPADTTAPAAPTGLTATAGNAKVLLDWNTNSEGDLAGYNIYRSTTSGSGYSKLNGSLLSSSDYNDTGVTNGTTYYYVVTAADTASNESDYSSQASATPAGTSTITIQENTTGFCSCNGDPNESSNSGYTGTGYVNTTNSSGSGINWQVSVPSSGTYTLAWRYALSSGDRTAKLLVNSSTVLTGISFPSTGSWTTWTEKSVTASLAAGSNTIRLEATTSGGLANIDYLKVTGTSPAAAACP